VFILNSLQSKTNHKISNLRKPLRGRHGTKPKEMKKSIVTDRTAVAFQSGNRFRFLDDETEYEFWDIEYKTDVPLITYYDSDKKRKRQGFHLLDLIRV
jgi:hypothetical protein